MNLIFVVTGPSGAGKTTIAKYIEDKYNFRRPKTITTRQPRKDEPPDAYIFTSHSEFKNLIEKNEIVEYVEYSNNLYGSHISAFENDENIVMVLEKNGCNCFKNLFGNRCITVLLLAGPAELSRRIKDRANTDDLAYRERDFDRYHDMNADHAIDAAKPVQMVKTEMDMILSRYLEPHFQEELQ